MTYILIESSQQTKHINIDIVMMRVSVSIVSIFNMLVFFVYVESVEKTVSVKM